MSRVSGKRIKERVNRKPPRADTVRVSLRLRLTIVYILAAAIPLAILVLLVLNQIESLSDEIRDIAIAEAQEVLSESHLEIITAERALNRAAFLNQRDQDILLMSKIMPSDEVFRIFSEHRMVSPVEGQEAIPLYDEITFIDLDGQELFKFVHPDSPKIHFPLNPELVNVSDRINTHFGAETYWEAIQNLRPGEIYVSSVVSSVNISADDEHYEGIVRWITPVVGFENEIWGFITMALNYDHLMSFADTTTPTFDSLAPAMEERLTDTIDGFMQHNMTILYITSICVFLLIIFLAAMVSSSVTKRIRPLIYAVSRFTSGERQYRINSKSTDEFGVLSNALDDMADSIVTDIQIAGERAEMASAAKNTFMSTMSHEIRTPLNAIIGMVNIGLSSDNIEKKDYSLSQIDNASKHLLGIVNDILDVSKIEANKYILSSVKFSFRELLMHVKDVIAYRVEQKRQNLVFNIDPNLPNVFIGDDQRLMQVITNLLSNSVKFTAEEGSIALNVSANDIHSNSCTLLVEVLDNGIGISREHQALLFKSFQQADSGASRKYGGTGLGLVICKSIIDMMGGKIWIDSEIGKGTRVSFLVRLAYDAKAGNSYYNDGLTAMENVVTPGDGIVSSVDFSGFSILLVEDVDINREIVLAMLESTNLDIDCAVNGKEAVDAFIANPLKYDMIFMDLQMPVMDGFEATRYIRQSGIEKAGSVPIVAMTANALREDVEMCLAAGMNGHLSKPLEFDLVIETLRKYLWHR